MNRLMSRLIAIGFFCILSFQVGFSALALCCKCHAPNDPADICLTGDSGSCSDLLGNSKNPNVAGYTCPTTLEPAACRTVADGGVCSQAGSVAMYSKPTEQKAPSSQPPLTPPNPSITVPGLSFSSTPKVVNGALVIPFIAQYISAMYNYLIGASLVVAAVMIVYGGFLYVLGGTVGSIQKSKEVIFNSIVGLCLVMGAFTILRMVSPPAASLKPLEVMVVKYDPMDDWFAVNGTTYPDSPTNSPPDVTGRAVAPGASDDSTADQQSQPMSPSDMVDVSGITYDSSSSACKNINKFCYTAEAKTADTFEKKQKVLAKAVLGFNKVCVQNNKCVYSQATQSSMGDCSLPQAKSKASYSVKRLNEIGISVEAIWPNNPDCIEAWKQKGGPGKVSEDPTCNGIARELFNRRINDKIAEAGVFASDCAGFVSSIYNCANAKSTMWGNALNAAVIALVQHKTPPAKFMQAPQLIVFTTLGDPELDAKIAQKGGLKFGDVFYVTGGSGQNALHYYLYTGGRKDVPFTFIEMGGSGPGANIPGVGVIKGANVKTISYKEDLKRKTTARKEYRYWCKQSPDPYYGKKKDCKENEMVNVPAAYSSDGVIMIWRPYADASSNTPAS